jgi:hypothetical protein
MPIQAATEFTSSVQALAAADIAHDLAGAQLKRALGFDRRVLNRVSRRQLRAEAEFALREAEKTVAYLKAALAMMDAAQPLRDQLEASVATMKGAA